MSRRQRELPLAQGEAWEVDLRELPIPIRGELGLPRVLLGVVGGAVVGAEALSAGDEVDAPAILAKWTKAPAIGKPRRPERLRVRDRSLREALREWAAAQGIAITAARRLPEIDEAFRDLETFLTQAGFPGYAPRTPEQEAAVEAFFRAAAAFYEAAPWRWLTDSDPLALQWEGEPQPQYAAVMGAGGETYGLALYSSWEALQATYDLTTAEDEEDLRHVVETIESVAVTYEDLGSLLPAAMEEMQEHRWPLADPTAYPIALRSGPQAGELAPEELGPLTVALEAVQCFATQYSRRLRSRRRPLVQPMTIQTPKGPRGVTIRYPVGEEAD
ncbi:MAG: hypothetical protein HY320_12745 [Armatimonadetes bacterium]|nr:hypothetical protein [Armatimonadota bacterium]